MPLVPERGPAADPRAATLVNTFGIGLMLPAFRSAMSPTLILGVDFVAAGLLIRPVVGWAERTRDRYALPVRTDAEQSPTTP